MKTRKLIITSKFQNINRFHIFLFLLLMSMSLFGQKIDITGDATVSGQLTIMDTILFADGTELASACLQILQDSDSDTKIEVEKIADEDIIRFTINGAEIARFENNRLELADGGGSVFIGYKAGENDDASGNKSVYIGYETGRLSNGFANTAMGANAFQNNLIGEENTTLGVSAGYESEGSNNVFVGRDAGRVAGSGNNNTYVGHDAGRSANGSDNVFLGKSAGEVITGSNKLAIDNTNTTTPLIYGEFDNNLVKINGRLNINGAYDLPEVVGASGQVLSYDGISALQWVNPSATSSFSDADGDTKIQVEKNADEDIIRFDIEGVERMYLDQKHLHLDQPGRSLMIGNLAGVMDDGTNNENVIIGYRAGNLNSTGSSNVYLGSRAGNISTDGSGNTFLGYSAGANSENGSNNTFVGYTAGGESEGADNTFIGTSTGFVNAGNKNTFLGHFAGEDNNLGNNNTLLGAGAGANSTGNSNVFIGFDAGKSNTGSSQLIIDNGDTPTPFIYGEFDNHKLEIDAWTQVKRRLDVVNNDLLFSNIPTGTQRGIKWSPTTTSSFEMLFDNLGFNNQKVNMQYNIFNNTRDIMTWDASGDVGIGTKDPARRLHVRANTPTGHVMRIENQSSGSFASGLEIIINRTTTGSNNNFITFKDSDGIAGRIEGFNIAEGDGYLSGLAMYPEIDFSVYFNPVTIGNIAFDKGEFPEISGGSLPSLELFLPTFDFQWPTLDYTPPTLSGGLASFSTATMANCVFTAGFNCSNPFSWTPISFNDGNLSYDEGYGNWNGGGYNWDEGSLPTFSGGSLPYFEIDAFINPLPIASATADFKEVICWALENGERSLMTTNPWDLAMLKDASVLSNLADCKNGGVTYGSGGADYAEYLLRDNFEEHIEVGQIVGVKGGKITKNTENAEQLLVISMMPIVLGNMPDDTLTIDQYEKVAFLGQAPVWVVGKVRSGDYIVPSGHHDGYGLAVAPEELTVEHIAKVVGRSWSDADQAVNLVNMVIGIKTNEMAAILSQTTAKVANLESRMERIEAALGVDLLASGK